MVEGRWYDRNKWVRGKVDGKGSIFFSHNLNTFTIYLSKLSKLTLALVFILQQSLPYPNLVFAGVNASVFDTASDNQPVVSVEGDQNASGNDSSASLPQDSFFAFSTASPVSQPDSTNPQNGSEWDPKDATDGGDPIDPETRAYLEQVWEEFSIALNSVKAVYQELTRMNLLDVQGNLEDFLSNHPTLTDAEKDRYRGLQHYYDVMKAFAEAIVSGSLDELRGNPDYADAFDPLTGDWDQVFKDFADSENLTLLMPPMAIPSDLNSLSSQDAINLKNALQAVMNTNPVSYFAKYRDNAQADAALVLEDMRGIKVKMKLNVEMSKDTDFPVFDDIHTADNPWNFTAPGLQPIRLMTHWYFFKWIPELGRYDYDSGVDPAVIRERFKNLDETVFYVVDIEHWRLNDQDMEVGLTNLRKAFDTIHQVNPNFMIGLYRYLPQRNPNAAYAGEGSDGYEVWQRHNDTVASGKEVDPITGAVREVGSGLEDGVDILFPSLYNVHVFKYDEHGRPVSAESAGEIDWDLTYERWKIYATENVREARRIADGKPVIPYLATYHHPNGTTFRFRVNQLKADLLRSSLKGNRISDRVILNQMGRNAQTVDTASDQELADALNQVLNMAGFYASVASQINESLLPEGIRELLQRARDPNGSLNAIDLNKLNRGLLEHIYPKEIEKRPFGSTINPLGWQPIGNEFMKWQLDTLAGIVRGIDGRKIDDGPDLSDGAVIYDDLGVWGSSREAINQFVEEHKVVAPVIDPDPEPEPDPDPVPPPEIVIVRTDPLITNNPLWHVTYTVDGVEKTEEYTLIVEGNNHIVFSEEKEFDVILDTIAPEIEIVSHVPDVMNSSQFFVAYRVHDSGHIGPLEIQEFTLSEGTNEVVIPAEDEAGNTTRKLLQVVFDKTPPQIQIISELPSFTFTSPFTVIYTVDGVQKEMSFDLGEPGWKDLVIPQETDEAGNVSIPTTIKILYVKPPTPIPATPLPDPAPANVRPVVRDQRAYLIQNALTDRSDYRDDASTVKEDSEEQTEVIWWKRRYKEEEDQQVNHRVSWNELRRRTMIFIPGQFEKPAVAFEKILRLEVPFVAAVGQATSEPLVQISEPPLLRAVQPAISLANGLQEKHEGGSTATVIAG